MGYFEFLHGSRIICLSLNIPEKLNWQHLFESQKRKRLIVFILVNTTQYPHTLKSNIYHSNKRGPPPFFHLDINPVLGYVLIYSVDKTHGLVVTVKLICMLFLNILSFNFIPTPNKSLRLTRFGRSYLNHPAIILINTTSYNDFWLMYAALLKMATFLFLQLFVP